MSDKPSKTKIRRGARIQVTPEELAAAIKGLPDDRELLLILQPNNAVELVCLEDANVFADPQQSRIVDPLKVGEEYSFILIGLPEYVNNQLMVQIQWKKQRAWINRSHFADLDTARPGRVNERGNGVSSVDAPVWPGSNLVSALNPGEQVNVVQEENGFYRIGAKEWVAKEFVDLD